VVFNVIFVTRVWESSPDEKCFADQNFHPSFENDSHTALLDLPEFSTGVCQNFARSFRNDNHISYRKESRFRNCSFRRDSFFALNNIWVWESRFKKTLTPQIFGIVISKWQSSIISKRIFYGLCCPHFKMIVRFPALSKWRSAQTNIWPGVSHLNLSEFEWLTLGTRRRRAKEYYFKISYRRVYHISFRKDRSSIIRAIFKGLQYIKCHLLLNYTESINHSIWLVKWKFRRAYFAHCQNYKTDAHFLLILFWRGLNMPCSSRLYAPRSEPFLSD